MTNDRMVLATGSSLAASGSSGAMIRTERLLYPQSWKPVLNPFAETVKKIAADWLRGLDVVHDEVTRELLEQGRTDLFGGFLFPTANFEHLITTGEFLALWGLFDDLVTEEESNGYLRSYNRPILDYADALRGDPSPRDADPFLRGWSELGQRLKARMSGCWMARMDDYFRGWLLASLQERETNVSTRRQGRLPDLITYLENRVAANGGAAVFYLNEYVEGFELPDEVINHDWMRELFYLGERLILLANDVMSLEKDMINGWANAVTVIQQEDQVSLAEALGRVVEMHNRELFRFLDFERQYPGFGGAVDPLVRLFLIRMHYSIRGSAEFERGAERYQWRRHLAPDRWPVRVALCSFRDE